MQESGNYNTDKKNSLTTGRFYIEINQLKSRQNQIMSTVQKKTGKLKWKTDKTKPKQ